MQAFRAESVPIHIEKREQAAVFSLSSSGGEGWGEEAVSSHTARVWILISDLSVLWTGHLSAISSKRCRCMSVKEPVKPM